jgi:hypothetical protein
MDAPKTYRRFEAGAVVQATLCVAWKVKCAVVTTMMWPTMAHPVWKAWHVPLTQALHCLHPEQTSVHFLLPQRTAVSNAALLVKSNAKVTSSCELHMLF